MPVGNEEAVILRAVVPDDIDAVIALSLRAWAPIFESFALLLGSEVYRLVYPDWAASQAEAVATVCRGPHVWVAVRGDSPVGFVAVSLREADAQRAEIDMIAVDPDHQRHGIATRLMGVALDFVRSAGVALVEVATGADPGHAAARRRYEAAGFVALPLVRYYKAL